MYSPRRFEVIQGSGRHLHHARGNIATTAAVIAILAAISFSASPNHVLLARMDSAPASVSAPPDEAVYFPAQYVNRGAEVPTHVEAF
jgi:hypothetical protein